MPIYSLTILITSCRDASPAGFWLTFQREYLVKNSSNQGLYGGHRAMYWTTDKTDTFSSKAVIDFAAKNGWQLIDRSTYQADILEKWIYNNKPIFPLSNSGFSPLETNNSTFETFPRWITTDIRVYHFKTGWVMIEPGTEKVSEENGFVIINDNATKMSVYHLWGE